MSKLEDAEDLIRSSNIQTLSKIDENGNTILHYVAEKNIPKLYKLLAEVAQELVNATNNKGETALEILTKVQQAEEIMMKNQNDIQEIFKLIAAENAKIGNTEEKGVLIFGKTGAGKSTLTYYIAGEKLKAILDKGDIFLEEETPVNDIKINHTTKSETKIPGKYKVGNTAIIDLPGFGHTGGIVQEIANAFYITRLFETTNHMKFILAIEETSLTRKDELINIIKQFAKTFTNIEPLKKSLSLFITKASDDTTEGDIKYALQQALDDNQDNEDMRPALNMLNLLIEQKQKDKLDIHFFPKPKSTDTTMCDNDLLNRIESRTEYLDLSMHKDLANMPISARSKEWAQKLLEATYTNLKDLINIFTDTIKQADNPNNIFKDRYAEVIKPWLPTMSIKYEDLINPFKYFSNLEQIKELQKLFNDQKSAQDIFLDALKTFAKYTLNDDILKQQIQEYAHVFNQRIEYNKFLSQICDNQPLDYSFMKQAVQQCKTILVNSLEEAIKSIKIEDDYPIVYYEKSIDYLDLHEIDDNIKHKKAIIYNNIGRILDQQGKYTEAAENYIKALESNPALPDIYERLGEILFEKKQYKEALKCFKVRDTVEKIAECFKKLIETEPNNPDVRIDIGNYLLCFGKKKHAIKEYRIALNKSLNDDNKHSNISKILINIKAKRLKAKEENITFLKSGKKYHYDQITIKELEHAIDKIKEPIIHNPLPNNLVPIPCNDNHDYEVNINGDVTLHKGLNGEVI